MITLTNEISYYQELVRRQLTAIKQSQTTINYPVYVIENIKSGENRVCREELGYCYEFIDLTQITELSLCITCLHNLINKGVIIELERVNGKSIYTTLHADIVFRVLRGRAFEDELDGRWVGNWRIDLEESYLPNFNGAKLEDLEELLKRFFVRNGIDNNISVKAAKAIINGLKKAGFSSLAKWQFSAIESILYAYESFYVIDAPTATGKTLAFMTPAIVFAIISKLRRTQIEKDLWEENEKVLLVYPRRALQRQQLENLIKVLHHVNENLRKELGIEITVGVDKGVEYGKDVGRNEDELFNIYIEEMLQGKLIQKRDSKGVIRVVLRCRDGREVTLTYFKGIVIRSRDRDFILTQNPDILITNPWTIKKRIKSSKYSYRSAYLKRSLIVLDEAHVYVNVNYLDLVAILKLYRYMLKVNDTKFKPKFILSSATINLEDKIELVRWVWGICVDDKCSNIDINPNDIIILDYYKLEPQNPNKIVKILITLLPYRLSAETIVQGILQVLTTALIHRDLKSLVFIDSISEASTLMKYIETILIDREGVEICDHILNIRCRDNLDKNVDINIVRKSFSDIYSDYSWSHLWPQEKFKDIPKVVDLLKKIKNSLDLIKLHHGALSDNLRREIEQGYMMGKYKTLITTSTLDLGMNFDDVTFIIQYKAPISDEALIQRIGRAGRKDESYRIALAFYVPSYTPMYLQTFASEERFKSENIILPHISVVDKMYEIELLELKIKEKLLEVLHQNVYGIKANKFRKITLQVLSNLLKSINIPIMLERLRPVYRSIKEIKTTRKDMEGMLTRIKLICARDVRKSPYLIVCEDYLRGYMKEWLKKVFVIFSKYRDLHPGLGIISDNEANNYLEDFKKEISDWIRERPKIDIINKNILFTMPSAQNPQCLVHIDTLIKPEECKKVLNDLNGKIDTLIKHVETLVNSVGNGRELITLFFELSTVRPMQDKELKVTINNFEYWWYSSIREFILEHLRLYLGLTARGENDKIMLRIG